MPATGLCEACRSSCTSLGGTRPCGRLALLRASLGRRPTAILNCRLAGQDGGRRVTARIWRPITISSLLCRRLGRGPSGRERGIYIGATCQATRLGKGGTRPCKATRRRLKQGARRTPTPSSRHTAGLSRGPDSCAGLFLNETRLDRCSRLLRQGRTLVFIGPIKGRRCLTVSRTNFSGSRGLVLVATGVLSRRRCP